MGGVISDDAASADVVLLVHTVGLSQGDWAMRLALPTPSTISAAWLNNALCDKPKKLRCSI
ncbi:MAG: DUF4127 family protein [Gammaproteobacteria bacterium]|nr:DUF4127 family protein [Gammaproteobacteria bacterium]